MVYLDTSALVPAFVREPRSDAVLAWMQSILCLDEAMSSSAKAIGLSVVTV